MPVHQVVMREDGLKEIYVTTTSTHLVTIEGPPSTPALGEYLTRLGISLEPGWRVEINLRAVEWIREAARRLRRGFLVLIDYGHEARDLYSVTHSSGTLTTFSRHVAAGAEQRRPCRRGCNDPASRTSPRMWISRACGTPRTTKA